VRMSKIVPMRSAIPDWQRRDDQGAPPTEIGRSSAVLHARRACEILCLLAYPPTKSAAADSDPPRSLILQTSFGN
jgi:hypothetical protein